MAQAGERLILLVPLCRGDHPLSQGLTALAGFMKKVIQRCPNCGRAKGHDTLCQQEAVWELEEMVSKLESQRQELITIVTKARIMVRAQLVFLNRPLKE